MRYFYFGHEWVVNSADVGYLFKDLFANPSGLEYDLIFTGAKGGQDKEGYATIYLVVRVPSRSALEEFVSKSAGKIGLQNWHPVSKEDFLDGVNPTKVPPLFQGKYIESIRERAYWNDQRRASKG
jgi:hypothetical protein